MGLAAGCSCACPRCHAAPAWLAAAPTAASSSEEVAVGDPPCALGICVVLPLPLLWLPGFSSAVPLPLPEPPLLTAAVAAVVGDAVAVRRRVPVRLPCRRLLRLSREMRQLRRSPSKLQADEWWAGKVCVGGRMRAGWRIAAAMGVPYWQRQHMALHAQQPLPCSA